MSAVLVVAGFTSVYQAPDAYAAQITNRKLQLVAGATGDGGSKPGGVVNHRFEFTLPGGNNVGSIKFEYCTIAQVNACVMPTGLNTNGAGVTYGGETGVTGFTLNKDTNGSPYLTRAAEAVGTNVNVTYQLNGVTNPSPANYTFYVRIQTFSSTDATGTPLDSGSVAASTANPIVLSGVMPESLIFCTGETITANAGVPDCTSAIGGEIEFNQLFSPSDTATATSQFAASTNAGAGYVVTVNGTTLTSGSNTIPAMGTAGPGNLGIAPTRGTSQFGMNLVANTAAVASSFPGTSANVAPTPNGTDLRGQATPEYNDQDTFKYANGDAVARSDFNTAGPTNGQIFTASYIVNVAGNQMSGTYSTTLTYICTPTF